jgi:adenylosuccinate synthase
MSRNVVVIGSQWGDEGKGKIVDLLTEKADVIVRFQGGNNAGHTLVVGERRVVLHLIPSGILHGGKACLIGNGVVLDPEVFCQELDRLTELGIDVDPGRLKISRKTHLIMPYHKQLDGLRELRKSSGDRIGTTGRGIGPAYEDKIARIGVRAADVLDVELMRSKVDKALAEKNVLFEHRYGTEPMGVQEVLETIRPFAERLQPYLADVSGEIDRAMKAGKSILFEGAQGSHLDIDHGTYPFVTSSNTVSGNAYAGSGCGPGVLDDVLAVVKAYTTRVGSGPFPTELDDAVGEHLQHRGDEFGATTGRRRRCGWLDLALLRESVRLNRPTGLALTKLDVLSGLEEIKVCRGYSCQGEILEYPPQSEAGLATVEPVYESLPGWQEDLAEVRSWDELPAQARQYIQTIEEDLGVPVSLVSVGPDRSQTLER